jgi:HD superfamily phosphodiesterase
VSELVSRLFEVNQQRYREAQNPLRSHGPDHHWRVYQHALRLAEKLNVTYDLEVLAGAALLHDMAAYYPEKTGEDYHDFDHKIAEGVLREVNFPATKIEATLDAIANHGSDPKFKQASESLETTLLRDADKLDVFGPIGVARIIMVRTLKGDTLEDIVDDFWTKKHLERKWQSVTYDETRELAAADYAYSRDFFKKLAQALGKE